MARDARAQRRNAERLGIAEPARRQRRARRRERGRRRRRRRLADLHVDDAPAGGLDARRRRHHVHHHERRHVAARRGHDQPFRRFEHRFNRRVAERGTRPAVAAFGGFGARTSRGGDCAVSTCRARRNGDGSTRMRAAASTCYRWRQRPAAAPAQPSSPELQRSMTSAEPTIAIRRRRPSRAMALARSRRAGGEPLRRSSPAQAQAAPRRRPADHPRRRDRAAAARIHPADPEGGRPRQAEHPGRHHQRPRVQRLRRRRPAHLHQCRRADGGGDAEPGDRRARARNRPHRRRPPRRACASRLRRPSTAVDHRAAPRRRRHGRRLAQRQRQRRPGRHGGAARRRRR